jgi:hypothetical protein
MGMGGRESRRVSAKRSQQVGCASFPLASIAPRARLFCTKTVAGIRLACIALPPSFRRMAPRESLSCHMVRYLKHRRTAVI